MNNNNSTNSTIVSNALPKNRMQNMNHVNSGVSNNSTTNNGKQFPIPYPFLPPPQSQAMTAQNPLSPSANSSMLPPAPMVNQSHTMVSQQSPMANTRNSFPTDRTSGTNLESNNNQTSNQSNSVDQSSTQQQHNPMLSPTRHLPFPYSNLNNYHRNF